MNGVKRSIAVPAGRVTCWGLVGGAAGAALTADAAPGAGTAAGGLLGAAIGALLAASAGTRRPAEPAAGRRLRWPVPAGVLGGGLAGGAVGLAVVAPRAAVDGGTLAAMTTALFAVAGGRLAAYVARRTALRPGACPEGPT